MGDLTAMLKPCQVMGGGGGGEASVENYIPPPVVRTKTTLLGLISNSDSFDHPLMPWSGAIDRKFQVV